MELGNASACRRVRQLKFAQSHVSGISRSLTSLNNASDGRQRAQSTGGHGEPPKRQSSCSPLVVKHSPALKKITLARTFGLSNDQEDAIVSSWSKISDSSQCRAPIKLIERALDALCAKEPAIAQIFVQNVSVKGLAGPVKSRVKTRWDHARYVFWLLNQTINNLGNPPEMALNSITDVGRKHNSLKGLGFKPSYWDQFGIEFVEVIALHDKVRKKRDAVRAWTILIAAVVDVLNTGFHKRGSSSPA